ncbi:MAG: FecR domain-containing protein [Planctomycetaceae bacterium]|nr:FecR domain-containing protein [Planctomycetaceae bacterium]
MTDLPASGSSQPELPLDDLIHGYLDGALSAGQIEVLSRLLADSPAAARQFARVALLHSRLQEALSSEATLYAPAGPQTAGSLSGGTLPGNGLQEGTLPPRSPLPETRGLPAGPAPQPYLKSSAETWLQRRPEGLSRRAAVITGAAGLCSAALILPAVLWWKATGKETPAGSLAGLEGDLRVERSRAGSRPATIGMELLTGDRLIGGSYDSNGIVRLKDGSWVTLPGRSTVVCTQADERGQTLLVESGTLVASVLPRPASQPLLVRTAHAVVRVVGTEFRVSTDEVCTEVQVREGTVLVTSASGGDAVEVTAGRVALTRQTGEVTVQPLEPLSASWEEDFADGLPAGWHGTPVAASAAQPLPENSNGAIRTAFIDRYGGHFLAGVRAVDDRGLFRITRTTHLHLTFTVGHSRPDWLNFFVAVWPGGDSRDTRNFKSTVLSDTRPLPGHWRTVTVPLDRFRSWRASDGRAIDWSGPPPAPADVLTTLWVGSPPPDRGLIIDRIRVTPDGPGRVTVQD